MLEIDLNGVFKDYVAQVKKNSELPKTGTFQEVTHHTLGHLGSYAKLSFECLMSIAMDVRAIRRKLNA